jgi:hypothetical protein
MKLAIYGDSYGREHIPPSSPDPRLWCNLLRDPGVLAVTNYCAKGSSLWFSYKNFIETNIQYDKIVFLVTQSGRLTVNTAQARTVHVSGLANAERNLKRFPSSIDRTVWNAAVQYYQHLYTEEYSRVTHGLMLEEIKKIRPDALLIPCFPEKESLYSINNNFSLWRVSLLDTDYYLKQQPELASAATVRSWWIELEDRRAHMNDANNKILADLIRCWVHTGIIELKIEDFVYPTEPVEYYFHR